MNKDNPLLYSSVRAESDQLEAISQKICKPGHFYNPNVKKCLPGNPYSAYSMGIVKNPSNMNQFGGNSGNSANMAIAKEVAMRKSKG